MKHFLVVYDRSQGRLVEGVREFSSLDDALKARFEREHSRPGAEIVVLSSRSRATLERTHARYFKSARELAGA